MIYFARFGADGPVKIGCSGNVTARLEQLRSECGMALRLLMTIPGAQEEEEQFHHQFAPYRIGKTEQFRPGPDLMDHLGQPRVRDWQAVREVRAARPTQFRLTPSELATANRLKEKWGMRSLSATIRLALQYCADRPDLGGKIRESGE